MNSSSRDPIFQRTLHIFAIFNLAVAHPLYQVLAGAPEFFVAHRATAIDLLLLPAIVSMAFPAALAALVWATGRISRRGGTIVHVLLIAVLTFVLALQIARRLGAAGTVPALSISAVMTAAVVTAYVCLAFVRTFAGLLAPAIAIVPAMFLARPAVRALMFPAPLQRPTSVRLAATPPIVLVIFDQLPLASLLDTDGRIDRRLYPGFAALADRATWFRDATAASDSTGWAVPPILTGLYPRRLAMPTATDYPNSLFTLLADTYRMKVFEPITSLCPVSVCPPDRQPLATRHVAMTVDEAIIFLHVIAPGQLAAVLPPISQDWNNFAAHTGWLSHWIANRAGDRRSQPNRFIQLIQQDRDRSPTLHVLHALLPHEPYIYARSGQSFTEDPRLPGLGPGELWTTDARLIARNYQAHLVQLGYADAIVGRLLYALNQAGLLDEALVAVTADHGARFRPGERFKWMAPIHSADILSVPLLIKLPGQRSALVSDRNAEAVDITPTIAAALGIKLPWTHDGIDLFDSQVADRPQKLVFTIGATRVTRVNNSIRDEVRQSIAWKLSLFRNGDPAFPLYAPYPALVGRPVADLQVGAHWKHPVVLHKAHRFTNVDADGDLVPAQITGEAHRETGSQDQLPLAVAVNGWIRSTTWTEGPRGMWSTLVPIESLRAGRNDVEVFVAREEQGSIVLHPAAASRRPPDLNLISETAREIWGVHQSGLYEQEGTGDRSFRWTDGAARVEVPIDPASPPKAVTIAVEMTGPREARLRILANGCELYNGGVVGAWSNTFSLAACRPTGSNISIGILSDTFHPRGDSRTLGVAVSSTRLLEADSR